MGQKPVAFTGGQRRQAFVHVIIHLGKYPEIISRRIIEAVAQDGHGGGEQEPNSCSRGQDHP